MTEVDASFVGGLMVGEGHFGIAVRTHRKTYRGGISLLPASSVGMNDVDTLAVVAEFLRSEQIPHWVFRHKAKRYAQINIHGLKRLNVFLPWMLPHLTGDKLAPATNLYEYITYRLSLPHGSPVTSRDLEFVRRARELNAGSGKSRIQDLDKLSRILRDYTSERAAKAARKI